MKEKNKIKSSPLHVATDCIQNKRLCHTEMEIFILQMKKQNTAAELTLKSHSQLIPYSRILPVHQLIPLKTD